MYRKNYEYDPTYLRSLNAIETDAKSLFCPSTELVQLYCYVYPVAVVNVKFRCIEYNADDESQYPQYSFLDNKYKNINNSFLALYSMMTNEKLTPTWNKSLVTIMRDRETTFCQKFDYDLILFEIKKCLELNDKKIIGKSLFDW